MKRRTFLETTATTALLSAFPSSLFAQSGVDFNELFIPPLLPGNPQNNSVNYDLQIAASQRSFLPQLSTPTYGINGDYLGPTLLLKQGDNTAINVTNNLHEATTLHWHGLHVPAIADGGPHQTIDPDQSWRANFSVSQAAGTFWYHSHMLGKTGEQVYKGLAGLIIIEDEQSSNLGLPHQYGVDDIPLVIQDRRFNSDGSFAYIRNHMDVMMGLLGDSILVNGTYNPLFTPQTDKVRFRLLNGANARTFVLRFDDNREFELTGCDGSNLASAVKQRQLILSPSERADIVVDFSDGGPANLVSDPLPAGSPYAMRGMMGNMMGRRGSQRMQILAVEPQSQLQSSEQIRPELSDIVPIQASEAIRERKLRLSMVMGMRMGRGRRGGMDMGSGNFFINDEAMQMDSINYRIPIDSTEIWEIENESMMMHPFHIHHNQFQILSRNGRPPAAYERGFKDTVKVGPGEIVRFIMRFENFADPEHPYMYHCHILEHEDDGMMGQFTVE